MRYRQILSWVLAIAVLACACCAPALAQNYPIYQVVVRPAFLRETPAFADHFSNAIYTVPYESLVLVAEEADGWCLVYTQDELTGYMRADDLKATRKTYKVDFTINADRIAQNAEVKMEFIAVDPLAVLPDDDCTQTAYPATLLRGEQAYDLPYLLDTLLGQGYVRRERGEYASSDDYESRDAEKPYRYFYVRDDTLEIWYSDSMVTGERGGEYEPPNMNMSLDESLTLCKALLNGVLPSDWLAHPGVVRSIQERWSYADRWMTDSEYNKYIRETDAHRIVFEHWSEDGISILQDCVMATVGVNGLAGLDINWHEFETVSGAQTTLMPLEDAIALANSTRMSDTVLLYASPVYSNWLTESDAFNLSWYLVTSQGNYVVDCVLGAHKCDSYEY